MSNNIINPTLIRYSDRVISISNSEYNNSKKNAGNYLYNQKKMIDISPSLLGYKLGEKYTGIVQKRISRKKFLIKVNNEIFKLSNNLHLDTGSSIYFEITLITERFINADVLSINRKNNFPTKNIKLEFFEEKFDFKFNHNSDKLSNSSTFLLDFLNLILIHEKSVFNSHIMNKLPSFDTKDSKKIIDLLTNIFNSKIQNWLGSEVVESLIKNKRINFQDEINKFNKLEKNSNWLSMILPFIENSNINILYFNFFLTDEKVKRLRFKIHFELSKYKEIIIEGLIGFKRINIKILSSDKFDIELESKIKNSFYKTLKIYHYYGTINFQKIINISNSIKVYKPDKHVLNYKMDI